MLLKPLVLTVLVLVSLISKNLEVLGGANNGLRVTDSSSSMTMTGLGLIFTKQTVKSMQLSTEINDKNEQEMN